MHERYNIESGYARVVNILRTLNDELHYKLLKILEQNPVMTQREPAREIGMSLGKASYCLKILFEKGWIKVGDFSRNRN